MIVRSAILVIAAAVGLSACAPQPSEPLSAPAATADSLYRVASQYFDAAFVREGADFSRYRQVIIHEPELAFRTPDRSQQQFPLSEDQKQRFRDMLEAQFEAALAQSSVLSPGTAPAGDAIDLHVRVEDILAVVPPRTVGQSGRGGIALRALGEATLVIEIRDSQSEEVLARVYDRRAVEGVAMFQQDAPITRWEDVDKLCERWATTVRDRIDAVVSGSY